MLLAIVLERRQESTLLLLGIVEASGVCALALRLVDKGDNNAAYWAVGGTVLVIGFFVPTYRSSSQRRKFDGDERQD